MSDWKPIETAPRDGTPILVYLPTWERQPVREVHWAIPFEGASDGWWETPNAPRDPGYMIVEGTPHAPTHWMPLPAPPTPTPEPKPEKGLGHPFVACDCGPQFCKYANREGCHEWNKIRGHICSAPASEHQARAEEPELHCWCSRPFPCAEHPPEPELLAPPVIRRVEEPTRELLLGHEPQHDCVPGRVCIEPDTAECVWVGPDGATCQQLVRAHYPEGSK